MIWISVDPGERIGFALWRNCSLVDCNTVGFDKRHSLPDAEACAIEMPRVYPDTRKWKGDPQIIVRLAFGAGLIAAQYPSHERVPVESWTGGANGRVLWRRDYPRLTVIERAIVDGYASRRRLSAHARDAIMIGLWVQRRPLAPLAPLG